MQQQATHKQALATLRRLRAQLQQTLASEAASSSDDEQLDSDQGLEEQRALSKDLAIEAGIWIVAPEAKAAQVLLQAGKCLKLGKQVARGGKVLIKLEDSKLSKEATQLIEQYGGKVVERLELTNQGLRKIGTLSKFKEKIAREVLKLRKGNASALQIGRIDYWDKPLGELANMAAAGDKEADTIIKLIKKAGKYAQQYGGK